MPMSDDATKLLLQQLTEDRVRSARTFEAVVRIEEELRAIRKDLHEGVTRMDAHDQAHLALNSRLQAIEVRAPKWDTTASMAKHGAGTLFVLFLGSLWALVARTPASDAPQQAHKAPPGESRGN